MGQSTGEMQVLVDAASRTVHTRRPMDASRPTQAVRRRYADRHRKQKLTSRLSDSGFDEDLAASPSSPSAPAAPSPLRTDAALDPAEQMSSWYLQYGDIGYRIQRKREAHFHPCKSLVRQPQLTAESRCKLVSWLIPVHKHFRLSFECCCLAVNIMDRFLASTPVAADCFQLLGVTALLLASKKVEVCSPRISHLLSLCCDAFTKEQLCNLECLILVRLNFCLAAPTLAFFLDYYVKCLEATECANRGDNMCAWKVSSHRRPRLCSNLAQKVCELSLADYAFNKYPPSLIASCALSIASELLGTDQLLMESHSGQWDSLDELCANKQSLEDTAAGGLEPPGGSFLLTGGERCSLAQECRDNLKLLVSLNQEALEMLSDL